MKPILQKFDNPRTMTIFLVILVPVCLLLNLLGWYFFQHLQVKHHLKELRENGLPVSVEDFVSWCRIVDETEDVTALWKEALAAVEVTKRTSARDVLSAFASGSISDARITDGTLASARQLVADHARELKLLRRAGMHSGLIEYSSPPENSVINLTGIIEVRYAIQLLTLDAYIAQLDGDDQRAFEDARSVLELANALSREPTMIRQLIRIAAFSTGCQMCVDLSQMCDWNGDRLVELQNLVVKVSVPETWQFAMVTERAYCRSPHEDSIQGPRKVLIEREILNLFHGILERPHSTWDDRLEFIRKLRQQAPGRPGTWSSRLYSEISELGETLQSFTRGFATAEAKQVSAAIALEAVRFRRVHFRLPESRAELMEWSQQQTSGGVSFIDPLDGAPLRWHRSGDEVTIYSKGVPLEWIDLDDPRYRMTEKIKSTPSESGEDPGLGGATDTYLVGYLIREVPPKLIVTPDPQGAINR